MYNLPLLMSDSIWAKVSAFDDNVYGLVSSMLSAPMTGFMKTIAFLGSGWSLSLAVLLILIISYKNRARFLRGRLVALNFISVSLINNLLKSLIKRQRPGILRLEDAGGYSFPSWHAMTAVAFFGFLIFIVLKYFKHRTKYLLAGLMGILVLLIGTCRIYLGVHYASDVLGGYVLGLAWLGIFLFLSRRVLP